MGTVTGLMAAAILAGHAHCAADEDLSVRVDASYTVEDMVRFRFQLIELDRLRLGEQQGALGRLLSRVENAAVPGPERVVRGALIARSGDREWDLRGGGLGDQIDAPFERITVPRIVGPADVLMPISVGEPIQFFEHVEGDMYRLVGMNDMREGVQISVEYDEVDASGVSIKHLGLMSTYITSRQEVFGTSMQVGAPVVGSSSTSYAMDLDFGEHAAVYMPSGPRGGNNPIIVVVTAELYEPRD